MLVVIQTSTVHGTEHGTVHGTEHDTGVLVRYSCKHIMSVLSHVVLNITTIQKTFQDFLEIMKRKLPNLVNIE